MAFRKGKMRERGRKWYKERGKWIIESRIGFSDPILKTLDTPHGPNASFEKNDRKMREMMRGKIIFSPIWCLIQKLDPISGLHAKNQREISSNKVGRLLWPFGGENAGKGGKWYNERGKWIIQSRIGFSDPMLMTLDTTHGLNEKFLKKITGKCGKNQGKN